MNEHRHSRLQAPPTRRVALAGVFAASVGLLTTAGVYAGLSGWPPAPSP